MHKLLAAALSASLLLPTAVSAADSSLAPGKPAGVLKAQADHMAIYIGLGVIAAVAIGVAVSGSSSAAPAPAPTIAPGTTG